MFWQSANGRRGGMDDDLPGQDAWWQAVELDWGTPGKAIWVDGELVAFALFAPPLHVQRVRRMAVRVSEDAIVLATMWCHPDHRAAGHARHLMQVIAREAIAHGQDAIEAYAVAGTPEGRCEVSGEVLESLGFQLHRTLGRESLYRLDLDRAVRWPSAVGQAIGEVLSTLQGKERVRSRPALDSRRSDQASL